MAPTRVISVIGRKSAGKTTLVVALVQEFVRRGLRVGSVKHGHHPAVLDVEGKDTWRHYQEARAERTLIESPGHRVLFERTDQESDPLTLIRRYLQDMDIVVLEGFKSYPIPKIEVHRTTEHPTPLFDTTSDEPGDWVAMVTDDKSLRLPFPCFAFTDTSWFTNLAHIAWDGAALIE